MSSGVHRTFTLCQLSANFPLAESTRWSATTVTPLSATFNNVTDAKAWARKIEGDIDQSKHYGFARVRTLADAIDAFTAGKATIKTADDRYRHLAWWRENFGG